MIDLKFNIHKIIQIVNYLLKKNDGIINYTKLLKLLYIADKKFFEKWDLSISQDSYASLEYGPILSNTYDLIKGEHIQSEQTQWNCLFFTDGYNLALLQNNNLTTNLLSKAEIQILDDTDSLFKDYSWRDLVDYTHKEDLFPEVKWQEAKQKQTSIPLPIEDILQSLNRTEEEIDYLAKEISTQQKQATLLSFN